MNWLIDFIMPPLEGSPRQKSWEWKVSLMLLLGGMALLYGGFRVAWAGDVEKKISDAVSRITIAQQAQESKIDRVTKLLTDQLADSVAGQIRLTIAKRCKTQGFDEREELNREKDRLQAQYYEYKGQRYIEPRCEEL